MRPPCWQDSRFAAIAILRWRWGSAVNTAIFTVVNAVLLQPLPYRTGRVVQSTQFPDGAGEIPSPFQVHAWKDTSLPVDDCTVGASGMNWRRRPAGEVKTLQVSSGFFQVSAWVVDGRAFTQSEDVPDGPAWPC